MNWKIAVIESITRISLRNKTNLISRQQIISEELEQIISDVSSKGATPEQTLSRILQDLRDEGYLEFDGNGKYLLLESNHIPNSIDVHIQEEIPERTPTTVHRILRDSNLVKELKRLYNFKCQICETRLELLSGYYCEVHHLKPLGNPHNGPDRKDNMIVVCPNHHVLLDYLAINLELDSLRLKKHDISGEYIDYHNEQINKSCALK